MSRIAYFTAALFLLPAPVLAQATATQPTAAKPAPTANANAKKDGEKIVCESQDTLGSRLEDHRVCMTKDQWAQFKQDEKDKVTEMQSRAAGASSN